MGGKYATFGASSNPTTTMTINNSFHNLCIINDCIGPVDVETFENLIAKQAERFTCDNCGNIRAIDGKRVTGGDFVYRLQD